MFKFLIFAGLLIGTLIPGQANDYPDEEESKNKKFDFLVFAQIWPVTSCDIWEAKSESNTCFLPQEGKHKMGIQRCLGAMLKFRFFCQN